MKEGLDAYGDGDTSTAIQIWRKVVAADPENLEALDFLQSADRRKFPRGEKGDRRGPADRADRKGRGPRDRAEVAQQDVIGAARRLIASRQYEESLELLRWRNEPYEPDYGIGNGFVRGAAHHQELDRCRDRENAAMSAVVKQP